MDSPKVSVIIANRNGKKYIAEAVDSVLHQTYRDFEIVAVDDASVDGSIEILERYAHGNKDLRIIRLTRSSGSAGARNRGIESSKGEFLCFLDSDDVYAPVKLERQLSAIGVNGPLVVAYCDWWRVAEDGSKSIRTGRPHMKSSGWVFADAITGVFGASTMFMIPRKCFDVVGTYDETLTWGEDYDLVLRLAKSFEFKYVDEPLYGYRTHPSSKRLVIGRRERLEFEALITERHLVQSGGLLDESAKEKVVANLIRYYSLTGQRRKMLRYGVTSSAAFRRMVNFALRNRPV